MKYTIVLRRANWIMEIFDDFEHEFYIANPDIDFATMEAAVASARKEVAKADLPELRSILRERGMRLEYLSPDRDNYEVVMAFEGTPKIVAFPGATLTEML